MNTTYNHQTISDFLKSYSTSITHVAVAHTPFYTYNASDRQLERWSAEARKQCWFFRRCFSQYLYGAKAHRKPHLYQPLLLTTLEGTRETNKPGLSIHYNFAIGNVPGVLTTEELKQVFTYCWVDKAGLSRKKIWLEEAWVGRQSGWLQYGTKEAKDIGNLETWDFENTQIPHLALTAD
jgi:hypothetical protein